MSENPQQPQEPQQPGPAPQQPQPGPAYGSPPPYQGQHPYQGQPQQGPAYGPGAPYQPQPLSPSDERMWSVFAQLGPIIVGFIAPLIIWLALRDRSRFVDQEAKESLNFQITIVIGALAIGVISVITLGIGAILYVAFIVAIVFMILAAVANGKGEPYRYPVNIRFVK
jgi:uncharacterized Tic20 family protein